MASDSDRDDHLGISIAGELYIHCRTSTTIGHLHASRFGVGLRCTRLAARLPAVAVVITLLNVFKLLAGRCDTLLLLAGRALAGRQAALFSTSSLFLLLLSHLFHMRCGCL